MRADKGRFIDRLSVNAGLGKLRRLGFGQGTFKRGVGNRGSEITSAGFSTFKTVILSGRTERPGAGMRVSEEPPLRKGVRVLRACATALDADCRCSVFTIIPSNQIPPPGPAGPRNTHLGLDPVRACHCQAKDRLRPYLGVLVVEYPEV